MACDHVHLFNIFCGGLQAEQQHNHAVASRTVTKPVPNDAYTSDKNVHPRFLLLSFTASLLLCARVGGGNIFFFFFRGRGEQAEHDTEARPILISTSETLVKDVNACLKKRLAVLPTRDTAIEAVKKGFAVVCKVTNYSQIPGDRHRDCQSDGVNQDLPSCRKGIQ